MLKQLAASLAALKHASTTKQFEHDILDTKGRNIRLVRILPGSSDSTIQCEIKHQALQEDHICLSYAWGDPEPTHEILIGGHQFHVRRNLMYFLLLARKHRLRNWLWIDAICIDQLDNTERSHQVALMADIYRQATHVLIWPGEVGLNKVSRRLRKGAHYDFSLGAYECSDLPHSLQVHLNDIRESEYWWRAWICQEVLLAKKAVIFCGSLAFPVENLYDERSVLDVSHGGAQALVASRRSGAASQGDRLFMLLRSLGHRNTAERKDIIYSLLGLLSNQSPRFHIDYAEPTLLSWMRAVQYVWAQEIAALYTYRQASTSHLPMGSPGSRTHNTANFSSIDFALSICGFKLGVSYRAFCRHVLDEAGHSPTRLGCPATPTTAPSSETLDLLLVAWEGPPHRKPRSLPETDRKVFDAFRGCCSRCQAYRSTRRTRFTARQGRYMWIRIARDLEDEVACQPREEDHYLDAACTVVHDPLFGPTCRVIDHLVNYGWPPKDGWPPPSFSRLAVCT